jgi:23S rRNA pseudouridine1911/1915/1917 synthase
VPKGLRLDRYIAEYLKILSRSQVKARNLKAIVNGKPVKVSFCLKGGDFLELSWHKAESLFLVPQNLPLDVIYEDEKVIVVNKAQGMVVHPGAGNRQDTLANALLYRKLHNQRVQNTVEEPDDFLVGRLQDTATGIRPGIVHRLDKDTSGVLIAAWDEAAHAFLSEQFKARKVRKGYAALVHGCPRDASGCIDKRIVRSRRDRKTFTVSDHEGRMSLTYFKLVRCYGDYSLLLLRPKTGRTHQLRVHLKYLGNPVLGDPIYGKNDVRFKKATLMLHAKSLSLVLPPGSPEADNCPVTFRAPLPGRFRDIIRGR